MAVADEESLSRSCPALSAAPSYVNEVKKNGSLLDDIRESL